MKIYIKKTVFTTSDKSQAVNPVISVNPWVARFPLRGLPSGDPQKQSGAVLAVVLLLLLIMTMLALSSMRTTTLESRMAGSAQQRNFIFLSAESLLEEAAGRLIAEPTGQTISSIVRAGINNRQNVADIGGTAFTSIADINQAVTMTYIGFSTPRANSGYSISRTGSNFGNVLYIIDIESQRTHNLLQATSTVNSGFGSIGPRP